jgi:hypothetical protein
MLMKSIAASQWNGFRSNQQPNRKAEPCAAWQQHVGAIRAATEEAAAHSQQMSSTSDTAIGLAGRTRAD